MTLNTDIRQRLEIPKTPSLLKRLEDMAQKGLSATALSNYIADPIQFYNNYVLRILENENWRSRLLIKPWERLFITLWKNYTPHTLRNN